MTAPPPPPGWYPDPSGQPGQRYWDGSAWHGTVPAPPRRQRKTVERKVLLAVGGSIAVVIAISVLGDNGDKKPGTPTTTTAASASPAPSITKTSTPSAADLQRTAAALAARRDPASYKPLTAREFALLAKDPDAHKGELVVIYGEVAQFDAATGTDAFRADTGPLPPDSGEIYTQNSLVTVQDPSTVAEVVEDDYLKMYVEVAGAHTYKTQMGGETTVPLFTLYIVENLSQELEQRTGGN